MQIRLMGGFEVVVDGRPVPPADWRRRQAAALVKLLALAPKRVLHREQVIDALWPDLSIDEAAPRLYKAAYYARRGLRHPRALELSGETVALLPETEVEIDAATFQRLAESARDAGTAGAAADAYLGDLLPHDRYVAWAEEPRERLRLLHLRMLRLAGRWDDIVNTDPTDESAHLELVRDLAGAGDARSALLQFERLTRGLREIGLAPSPGAVRLRDQLVDSVRGSQGDVVIIGGRAAHSRRSAAHTDGDLPYERVVGALSEWCRNHPTLSTGAAPTVVVIMQPSAVRA
jgi:DNA-binding SARP family transcriptional activator